jgi:hypothetical protein
MPSRTIDTERVNRRNIMKGAAVYGSVAMALLVVLLSGFIPTLLVGCGSSTPPKLGSERM